jgi:hypothetical protein
MSLETPIKIREFQRKLYAKAKQEPHAELRVPRVKSVGKPDAGDRHVRFDERGRETGLWHRAFPRLYPTSLAGSAVRFLCGYGSVTRHLERAPSFRTHLSELALA